MEKKGLISISQPTFLPWSGYFDLIDSVEKFVFLNDVQFSRQSWQQRNKIISNNRASLIVLPVSKSKGFELISKTKVLKDSKEVKKFIKKIKQNYSKAEYFEDYFYEFEKIFKESLELTFLDKFNIEIIKWIVKKIGIKTQLLMSSDLNIEKNKSAKIIEICKKLNSSKYLSNFNANKYLANDIKLYKKEKIEIFLHNYKTEKYKQFSNVFDGHISILDMLFNEGPRVLSIIRKGRREGEKFT